MGGTTNSAICNSQFAIQSSSFVVVLPACNEEAHIGSIISSCRVLSAEVWVIDDGSTDGTGDKARKAGARVITHEQNLGKGMAIRTAFTAFTQSDHEYLILMDADGQHDPAYIPALIERVRESKAGIVIGNRMLSKVKMPWVRRWTNQVMSWMISRLAGQTIPDSQCGYRLVSRSFAERFRPTTCRFDLESEMLIQAGRLGFKIQSVPISTIYEGQSSHIRIAGDTLRFLRLLVRYFTS